MSDRKAGGKRVPDLSRILLIDDDPIFRLGLRTALEPFADIQVVAEADTGAAALELLSTLRSEDAVDLVVLELGRDRSNPNEEWNVSSLEVEGSEDNLQPSSLQPSSLQPSNLQPSNLQPSNLQPSNLQPSNLQPSNLQPSNLQPSSLQPSNLQPSSLQPSTPSLSGLALCQQLKAANPNLPVLLLTAQSEPRLLLLARESGIDGYCPKGCAISQIVQAIRQLISGQSYWQMLSNLPPAQISSVRPPRWHHNLRSYGLRQIEEALAQVTQQLQNPNLSNLDWLFWSGRRRELLAARWLVNQLLPTDVIVVERESRTGGERERKRGGEFAPLSSTDQSSIPNRRILPSSVPIATSQPSFQPQQATLFDATLAKLQSGLSNLTSVVLEIDILQTEKKRNLLYIVLRKFEEILEELRFSQVTLEQLPQKRSLILQDLWQVSVTDFLGKYYTLPVGDQEFEVVDVLLQNAAIVQVAILDKIPLVVELLAQQLFETPLMIDNVSYPARTPEAMAQAEILLHHLIIQVANAVIQPLLNEFADIDIIKQNFYDRRLISSREITRFRNNLSWRYRISQLLDEPKAIFESRYNLFVLSDTGIKQISIYAPRRQELEQLRGIELAVTLAYEIRDAIAPRLRSTIAWMGRGVVYILTQVLGKSIGLVVRGVIQGIGSSIQDTRFGKNSDRGK